MVSKVRSFLIAEMGGGGGGKNAPAQPARTKEMSDEVFAIGARALANVGGGPIDKAGLIAILATGEGPGHSVRALSEDCSAEKLDRRAMAAGLSTAQIRAAYRFARVRHGAANADIESEDPGF